MAEIDQTIAAGIKTPAPMDVIGPITSLAQLQSAQANAERMRAETGQIGLNTQFTAGKLQALQRYNDAIKGGAKPEEALGPSGLAAYDPAGANAILGNVQSGMTIAGTRGYAANPNDPNSGAAGGPVLVGQAATAAQTQATTAKTKLENTATQAQLYGQIGNIMASDPSPQGRAQAAAMAQKFGAPPDLIQKFMALPDDQYVLAGKHFQQASMTPEKYMEASGQTTAAKAAAEANYKPIITEPSQGVTLPPGLGNVMYPGRGDQAAAPAAGNPSLGNFGPPGAAAPSLTPAAAPGDMPAPGAQPASLASTVPAAAPAARAAPPTLAPPATSPPAVSGAGQGSPGLSNNKNNNPGNIRDGSFAQSQPDYIGSNGGFAVFSSPLMGQAASEKNLASYGRQGINTPLAIASKWAPAGDGANNPQSYASFIAGRLGIGVNDKIDLSDPAKRTQLAVAMSQQENGTKGYLGPNMSGALIGGKLAPGATSPNQTIPGATPLANMPPIAGSAPILPASLAPPSPVHVASNGPLPAGALPPPAPPVATPEAPAAPAPPIVPAAMTVPSAADRQAGVTAPVTGTAADAAAAPLVAPKVPATGPVTLQPGMTLAEKAAAETTGHGMAEMQIKQLGQAKEAYQAASTAQMKINQLQQHLADLPDSGLLTPGSGATERIGMAKYANTLLSMAGAAPMFDPKQVAAAEASQKITGGLGFDMSRTLGSREAAQIVHQAISLNPGAENTPQGAKVVAGAINAGLQRTKDFYQFISDNGNKATSDLEFNRQHPVAQYVREAHALAAIPQPAIDLIQEHPESSTLVGYFEKHYGAGMSRYFTGQ